MIRVLKAELDDGVADGDELPLESNFIEQAEYMPEDNFNALSAEHPDEASILKRLTAAGAKLLVGPRGCGKTTMLLKAFNLMLHDEDASALPIYVNFKLSLKMEPLYNIQPNASYWFRLWINLKIFEALIQTLANQDRYTAPIGLVTKRVISTALGKLESGRSDDISSLDQFTLDSLIDSIEAVIKHNSLSRCVLLLDDAAHAFSPRQQEDFFDFFRQIKSRLISPKAAVYPGITAHSPTFHVGHDAEQIDAWIKPDSGPYVSFMRDMALRRFDGELPRTLVNTPQALEFLAFSSFGIPRSFLNMLREIYHLEAKLPKSSSALDRRKIFDVAKQSREASHNVYDSLASKLPAYKQFVSTGRNAYQEILQTLKNFNRHREHSDQALQIGLKRPIPQELVKVLSFLQYAGLMMPVGENSRGVKGVFDLFIVHFGDLVTENAIICARTKSIQTFVLAFKSQTHQVWPRINPDTLVSRDQYSTVFRLHLPNCQVCGSERPNEHAKFCQNCGSQLKASSLYDELINQDISVLPLSNRMIARIKQHSTIRRVKDILIDNDRKILRGIPRIGPIRATRIATYAEEHVA